MPPPPAAALAAAASEGAEQGGGGAESMEEEEAVEEEVEEEVKEAGGGGGGGGGEGGGASSGPAGIEARCLPPPAASARLGYEDCNAVGSFALSPCGTRRVAVKYSQREALSAELAEKVVEYDSLRAFETEDGRGWGLCCAKGLARGDVVVEAVGRCLSEGEYEALEGKEYVVSFDDETLARKRAAGEDVL